MRSPTGGASGTVGATSSRWTVVAAYAALCAATQVLWVSYAPVTNAAARHYGVSVSAVGWLAQVFPLVYVLLAIPVGVLLDRSFRGGLLLGGFLTATGGLVRLVSDDFVWALAGQTVAAVGQPFVLNAITGLAAAYLVERDRARGIAVASAATFSGIVAGFLIGALLPGAEHVRTVTAVTALGAAVAAALVTVTLRHAPSGAGAPSLGGLGAFRVAWSDRYLRRLCALVLVPFGTFIALSTFAQPLLEPAGVSESAAGLMLVVNVVAGIVGCAVVPDLADRRRRELSVLVTGVLVAAAGCAVLAVAPGLVSGFVVLGLIGLALLPTLPVVLLLTERRAGQAEGTAAGLVWMAGNLGGLVIAGITGALVGHPTLAFAVLAVLTAAALPAVARFRSLAESGERNGP